MTICGFPLSVKSDPRAEQCAALGSQGAHYWKRWSCLIWAMKLSVCKQFFNQTHTHRHTHLVCFVFSLLVWDYLFLCSRWGERHNTFITDKHLHFTCTMKHHGVPKISAASASPRSKKWQSKCKQHKLKPPRRLQTVLIYCLSFVSRDNWPGQWTTISVQQSVHILRLEN